MRTKRSVLSVSFFSITAWEEMFFSSILLSATVLLLHARHVLPAAPCGCSYCRKKRSLSVNEPLWLQIKDVGVNHLSSYCWGSERAPRVCRPGRVVGGGGGSNRCRAGSSVCLSSAAQTVSAAVRLPFVCFLCTPPPPPPLPPPRLAHTPSQSSRKEWDRVMRASRANEPVVL